MVDLSTIHTGAHCPRILHLGTHYIPYHHTTTQHSAPTVHVSRDVVILSLVLSCIKMTRPHCGGVERASPPQILLIALLLLSVVCLCRLSGVKAQTQFPASCPSSTSSPSNPVGCILSSFSVPASTLEDRAVTYNAHSSPPTLLVTSNSSIAVYTLDGTLVQQLNLSLAFDQPVQCAVDSAGYIFVAAATGPETAGAVQEGLFLFAPSPSYAFLGQLVSGVNASSIALSTVAGPGEVVYVGLRSSVVVYELVFSGSVPVGAVQVAALPVNVDPCTQPNATCVPQPSTFQQIKSWAPVSVAVHPTTGQLSVYDPVNNVLTVYNTTSANSAFQLTSTVVWNANNSALLVFAGPAGGISPQSGYRGNKAVLSAVSSDGVHIFGVLALINPIRAIYLDNLYGYVALMNGDGTAVGEPGLLYGGGELYESGGHAFMDLAASPDASIIFVPQPQYKSDTVLLLQGVNGVPPAPIYAGPVYEVFGASSFVAQGVLKSDSIVLDPTLLDTSRLYDLVDTSRPGSVVVRVTRVGLNSGPFIALPSADSDGSPAPSFPYPPNCTAVTTLDPGSTQQRCNYSVSWTRPFNGNYYRSGKKSLRRPPPF